jgi:hypothetical protein
LFVEHPDFPYWLSSSHWALFLKSSHSCSIETFIVTYEMLF